MNVNSRYIFMLFAALQVRSDEERPGFAFSAISVLDESTGGTPDVKVDSDEDDNTEKSSKLTIAEQLKLSRDNPHAVTM